MRSRQCREVDSWATFHVKVHSISSHRISIRYNGHGAENSFHHGHAIDKRERGAQDVQSSRERRLYRDSSRRKSSTRSGPTANIFSIARLLAWRVSDAHAVCRLEFDLAWFEPACQYFRQVRLASEFLKPAKPGKRPGTSS